MEPQKQASFLVGLIMVLGGSITIYCGLWGFCSGETPKEIWVCVGVAVVGMILFGVGVTKAKKSSQEEEGNDA